jgi:hypothetical protein
MKSLLLLCGALSGVDLPLPMRLSAGELLAFVATPFIFGRISRKLANRRLKTVSALLLTFAVGVALSDIYNQTQLFDHLRGLVKPIAVGIHAAFFIGALSRNPCSVSWFFYGRVIGALINYIRPSIYTQEFVTGDEYSSLAFTLVPVISASATALAIGSFRKGVFYTNAALLGGCAVLLIVGAPRSNVLNLILPAIIIVAVSRARKDADPAGTKAMAYAVIVTILGVFGASRLYVMAAERGLLSEIQNERYYQQFSRSSESSGLIGLITLGRTEVYAALLAIRDRPLVGFGSWSGVQMSNYFYEALTQVAAEGETLVLRTQAGSIGAAGHSIFFTGWLENGVMAALALVGMGIITIRVTLASIRERSELLPIVIIVSVALGWDWLFSPLSITSRTHLGLMMALYVLSPESIRSRILIAGSSRKCLGGG